MNFHIHLGEHCNSTVHCLILLCFTHQHRSIEISEIVYKAEMEIWRAFLSFNIKVKEESAICICYILGIGKVVYIRK